MSYQRSEKHRNNARIASALGRAPVPCPWCQTEVSKINFKKHLGACASNPANHKICPVCSSVFVGKATTCSNSCANTFFRSGASHPNFNGNHYRQICFRYHGKKCAICAEENIVEVHHLNENHDDDRPENLIPLCPTHHQYWHSSFRAMVEPQILAYIKKWIETQNSC